MNGFQKEYWEKRANIGAQKAKYNKYCWIISILINCIFFYQDGLSMILFAKIVTLTLFLMGLIEWKLDLPNFYIEDDNKNKNEVRFLMIFVPLIIYILLLIGWFDK